ncbi:hypothetical protein NC652_027887 [Populus alba x Populus x berolinensis]|nr:hypothetical protein NC652_027887 [Populus alba x Populus x berolinensis]
MQLGNPVIAILLVSIISKLTKENSILEGVQNNLTTASSTSISPWLKNAMNHDPRPWPPGCWSMPWTCREGLNPPPARMRCCRNHCVDVSSDVNNCGFCGIRCPFTWQCSRGFSVDTNRSPFNCGRCGKRCPWRVRCVYGMCGYAGPFPPRKLPDPPTPHPPFPFPHRPPKPWPPHRPGEDRPPSTSEDLKKLIFVQHVFLLGKKY